MIVKTKLITCYGPVLWSDVENSVMVGVKWWSPSLSDLNWKETDRIDIQRIKLKSKSIGKHETIMIIKWHEMKGKKDTLVYDANKNEQ